MTRLGWRPARFTTGYRGQAPEPPAIARWEDLLRAEQTPTFHLVMAFAHQPLLRRLFSIPAHFRSPCGPSLAGREERVKQIYDTRIARLIEMVPGTRRHDVCLTERDAASDLPRVGPLLGHEIDAALGLLSNMAFEELQRRGWHLQPNHFYWPLNDLKFLRENPQLWANPKLPTGVDWGLDGQVELAQRLARYAGELADVREGPPERSGEFIWAPGFSGMDAYAYYGLVRDLRPARVVEVGVGSSSLLLRRAVAANGETCEVTLIDPFPPRHVVEQLPEGWQAIPSMVQHVDMEVFSGLEAGDLLFYDGSHCVRTGSDVNWMFFEVLPRLAPGVWIHVHDMSWPMDYWPHWIFDEGLSWNEQYLVQAFLMHNAAYRVRLGAVMLNHYKFGELEKLFPSSTRGATSLWLEKVA